MKQQLLIAAIRTAGAVQLAIIAANVPLPGRLRLGERLAGVPRFLCQIFYVHWIYIGITLALFAVLCFSFARELAGASPMGRFLSAFMGSFWSDRPVSWHQAGCASACCWRCLPRRIRFPFPNRSVPIGCTFGSSTRSPASICWLVEPGSWLRGSVCILSEPRSRWCC